MKFSKSRITGILSMLFIVALLSCEEHAESDQSYFPLHPHHEWRYQRWIAFGTDGAPGQVYDTTTLVVQNEVTVDWKTYRAIVDGNGFVDKIVRQEGSKYFGRNHELYQLDNFSHEYVFLDTDKDEGESWYYNKNDGYSKTEYVIQAKNTTRTINGKEYRNVIEVKVNYYHQEQSGELRHLASVIHCYAKGVGEIYYYYPYPTLMYGNITGFIINKQ